MAGRIIYWVQSVSAAGKDRVPMYHCGTWERGCADGQRGDIRVRPVRLGEGEFTMTVAPDDCEEEDGSPVRP